MLKLKREKEKEVRELAMLIDRYPVVGVLNMQKLPSRQLQEIRHNINAKIKMSKRSLTLKAMENSKAAPLKEKVTGPSALLFSEENPFKLFRHLKERRSPASAKAGDVATKDIVIQKGGTGLPPGPAISTLTKIGLKASVQGGKIAVLQDKIVVNAGETISEDVAGVLSLLKVQPLEIGLDLTAALEGGFVYGKQTLDISVEAYVEELQKSVFQAINLSINTGYPTKQTIEMMLTKAFMETKSLAIEANAPEKDFIDDVLQKAIREAKALNLLLGKED